MSHELIHAAGWAGLGRGMVLGAFHCVADGVLSTSLPPSACVELMTQPVGLLSHPELSVSWNYFPSRLSHPRKCESDRNAKNK